MFESKCLGELKYEATTSAIVMAGLFVSFLVELITESFVLSRLRTKESNVTLSSDTSATSLLVMEAGIIFHSIR